MKRLGPELKMPDLSKAKAPPVVADVYYDLRDRRLLPLVALVAVAIVAVPFLLGDSGEPAPPPVAAGAGAAVEAAEDDGASLTVVEAKPGLRDYRKRLRGTPTDPFVQRYTGVPKAAQLRSVEAPSGGEGGGGEPSEPAAGGGEGAAGGGSSPGSQGGGPPEKAPAGGGSGKAKPPRLITFVVDVQISRSEETAGGGRKMSEPKVRRRVRPFTQLPGRKAPVVTTMGANLRTGKIMFLVSDEARSLDGDFRCVARTPQGICELLEVEPGFPFDVLHGANKVRYRFKVTKVDVARAGRVGDGRSPNATLKGSFAGALAAR